MVNDICNNILDKNNTNIVLKKLKERKKERV